MALMEPIDPKQPDSLESLLTTEQEFTLRRWAIQIPNIPREDLEQFLLSAIRQKMAQETVFRGMMRKEVSGIPGLSSMG